MPNISHGCLINFLEDYDPFIIEHRDNWADGEVTYHFFNKVIITIDGQCVEYEVAHDYLSLFDLQDRIHEITIDECGCDF